MLSGFINVFMLIQGYSGSCVSQNKVWFHLSEHVNSQNLRMWAVITHMQYSNSLYMSRKLAYGAELQQNDH